MTTSTPNAAHLYAQATAYRTLFANARDPRELNRFLEEGKLADMALVDVPISSPADAVIKLASAIDWLSEDASAPVLRMLESILAYLKGQCSSTGAHKASKDPEMKFPPEVTPEEFFAASLERAKHVKFDMELALSVMEKHAASKMPASEVKPSLNQKSPCIAASQKVVVDRRMRPTWVDGVLYPSTCAAARSLGVTPHAIKKMAS